ncbi:hypothetical protein R6258_07685 [Halomonas sp. HP20-15]|uniref:hypothetical protein n=1 Tax=Halomonas sp. HP20-15 TaxID=3085901 RepID=UPI002980AADF|nr:hypothetical protein [Halomonas sp. HP20-15]MDW5376800.1 hypothetical protein [Halomonas sp. HP20-15]
MKERPILMNGEMVRALLDGRKTQTRRVVKPTKDRNGSGCELAPCEIAGEINNGDYHLCPYGQPGDRLWVREAWTAGYYHNADADDGPQVSVIYRADSADMTHAAPSYELAEEWERSYSEDGPDDPRWRPSIHMPRWASRIMLEIVSARVERLQEISKADALAEGITHRTMNCPRHEYFQLWNDINGDMAHEANPWVWVVEFKRVESGSAAA